MDTKKLHEQLHWPRADSAGSTAAVWGSSYVGLLYQLQPLIEILVNGPGVLDLGRPMYFWVFCLFRLEFSLA